MDLWVVAAAAGAGYLAKYWNKSLNNGDNSHHLSSEDSFFENTESSSCPFSFHKKTRRGELGKDRALDGKFLDGLLTGEVASKRGFKYEKLRQCQNYSESDLLSISNLAVPLPPYDDNVNDVEDENEQNGDIFGNIGFFLPEFSAKVVPIHNPFGHKTFLRTKNFLGHTSRPLNSLESCFMAQLYKEHAKMEEYVFSPLSSASTGMRSFVVSSGSRILNRGSKECNKLHKAGRVQDKNIVGVPSLPKIGLNHTKKVRFDAVTGRGRKLSSSDDGGKLINTHNDPTFLFSLGISFGMITSIMAYKREIDKLRELLKQSDNLVQDLQEELEMNDSMTVKEIHNENYGSQDTCDHSFNDKELNDLSPEKHMENSPRIDCQESYDKKEEHSSDSMSKIEAELEAELERLGLDMNASSLERKLSELVEIEPEFVADFAQGELRADKLSGKDTLHPKSNEDANEITPVPGNYAVLPHELSLRLHEVIQSQLEERVKELEFALEQSQRKVKLLESEHESSFQKAASLTSENCDTDTMSQPLVLNLSGEALDAYNEAYEELIKINESEEDSPSGILDSDPVRGSHSHDWNATIGDQHGVANDSATSSTVDEGILSREVYPNRVTMLIGKSSSIDESSVSEDENCDYDDNEVERQLIRQIVERTKKGSPFVQHAQKILCSMDEDEH